MNFPKIVLLGPQGCGKSTLVRHMTGEFDLLRNDVFETADPAEAKAVSERLDIPVVIVEKIVWEKKGLR